MGKSIPNGWMDYQPLGLQVPGTPFIPFKVPLKQEICKRVPNEEEWFTPSILVEKVPQLKVIIDLTATDRYYNPMEFSLLGVEHKKVIIEGQGKLPRKSKLTEFYKIVDDFISKYSSTSDALLGVHCTHGLNRTGYLICKYMVEKMKIDPQEAISRFEKARGYPMEREVFTNDISNKNPMSPPRRRQSEEGKNWNDRNHSNRKHKERSRQVEERTNWRDRNDSNRNMDVSSKHHERSPPSRPVEESKSWRDRNDSNRNKRLERPPRSRQVEERKNWRDRTNSNGKLDSNNPDWLNDHEQSSRNSRNAYQSKSSKPKPVRDLTVYQSPLDDDHDECYKSSRYQRRNTGRDDYSGYNSGRQDTRNESRGERR